MRRDSRIKQESESRKVSAAYENYDGRLGGAGDPLRKGSGDSRKGSNYGSAGPLKREPGDDSRRGSEFRGPTQVWALIQFFSCWHFVAK